MASEPARLRTDFNSDPKGLTVPRPCLSWWVNDNRPAELQTAYHIIAASSEDGLQSHPDLWDSGVVDGDANAHVVYAGKDLPAGARVWWKVRTFDSDGLSSPWSATAYFEMSPVMGTAWKARWIATPLYGSRARGVQIPILRREFFVDERPVFARLVVACLGDYRVWANGERLSQAPCSPVWGDYTREVYYQTYDVTGNLEAGPNALAILLADGTYSGLVPDSGRGVYNHRPMLMAQLHVQDAQGRESIIVTDHRWHWHTSWLLGSELNGGEDVDSRQQISAWSEAGLDELFWSTVDVVEDVQIEPVAQMFPVDRVQQVLRPQSQPVQAHRDGRFILQYDFGEQIVGRCRVDLRSLLGEGIELDYSLDDSFTSITKDTYTSRGSAVSRANGSTDERFETEFALHSFRFLRISYAQASTEIGEVYALRIALSDSANLEFRCEHRSVNQLFEVVQNSLRGVAQYVPWRNVSSTERKPDASYLGTWLNLFVQQGNYSIAKKWLHDIINVLVSTEPDSSYAPPIPGAAHRVDVIATFATLAHGGWVLYRYFDDKDLLRQSYPVLRAIALGCREPLVRHDFDPEIYGEGLSGSVVATAALFGALKVVGRIAGVLTNIADYEVIEARASDVKKAFRERFLTHSGHLVADTQSAHVAALHFGLLETDEQAFAEDRLIGLVQDAHYHTDVEPAVVHALLPTLTNAGRLDLAYMILLQTSQPSWLHNVEAGFRLVARRPEQFDIAQAGLMQWVVESMVGLSLDDDYSHQGNGFRKVRIRPRPPLGELFLAGAPIQFVDVSLNTLNGRYSVRWRIEEDRFELNIVVPPNCRARVQLPDDTEQDVASGSHDFVVAFQPAGDGIPILMDRASVDERHA